MTPPISKIKKVDGSQMLDNLPAVSLRKEGLTTADILRV